MVDCNRFERLDLKCLNDLIEKKYVEVLGVFSEEMDRVRKVVQSSLIECSIVSLLFPVI